MTLKKVEKWTDIGTSTLLSKSSTTSELSKGPFIYYVSTILEFFDPPTPLTLAKTEITSDKIKIKPKAVVKHY